MAEPIIAITMGDPAGIGPEVIVKAHAQLEKRGIALNRCVIGDLKHLDAVCEAIGTPIRLKAIEVGQVDNIPGLVYGEPGLLCVIDLANVQQDAIVYGNPDMFTGKAAIEYILAGLELARAGSVSAIATGPVCKRAICDAGFKFSGHTGLIAGALGVTDYAMMFVCRGLRVFLLTEHVPVCEVPGLVTRKSLTRLLFLTQRTVTRFFGIPRPKIAVCGLNPHSGEEGVLGSEEKDAILPAIRTAQRENIDVQGPFPADALFVPSRARQYDAIIAMYHDQGLIPVKMTDFRSAVNVTVGLPVIRVSVAHGTANDIAGKWVADPTSMIEALILADRMARLVPG